MSTEWIATLFAFVAVLWTALPLLRHEAWWIRAFEFPRVQIAALTALLLIAYAAVAGLSQPHQITLALILALCVFIQLIRIIPYTPVFPKQVRDANKPNPANSISLLVANVWLPNREDEMLLKLVRAKDPDVVLFVETDSWWESRLNALDPDYPYSVKHPLDNLYGLHLYSKLELIDPEVKFLIEEDVPSVHSGIALRSGHRVHLHCLHPAPPSPTENPTAKERDAELLMVAKALDDDNRSVIVCGDLNDVAWSYTTRLFQKISGLIDPRIGRGMYSTFHARYPFIRWPLDHIFFSTDFTLIALERLPYFGSDHFPICASICHTPGAEKTQDAPDAGANDNKRAREKIEQVGVNETLP